jgi:hypothetical protein
MKETYKERRFNYANLNMIDTCNEIIEEYLEDDLKLTLRQLYYQLVTKNIIANEEKEYQKLSYLLSNARLAGLVDWDAIEDRVRVPFKNSEFDDIEHLVEVAVDNYRLPRWADQKFYVELWVEKDALAGVLKPIADKYHITLMVNRGYSSQSAMYESAQRIKHSMNKYNTEKGCIILYLGDLDPSGEDMVRDIQDRLVMFGAEAYVKKVALTKEQVDQYDPPPNPTKVDDPRAAGYIKKYGHSSWEVDALPPTTLTKIIEDWLVRLVDKDKMDAIVDQENRDIQKLRDTVEEKNDED